MVLDCLSSNKPLCNWKHLLLALVIGIVLLKSISRNALSSARCLAPKVDLILEYLLDSWLSDDTWGKDWLRNVLGVVVHNRSRDVLQDFLVLLFSFSQVKVSCLVKLRFEVCHGLVEEAAVVGLHNVVSKVGVP